MKKTQRLRLDLRRTSISRIAGATFYGTGGCQWNFGSYAAGCSGSCNSCNYQNACMSNAGNMGCNG